jgi:hypothetical protein
VTDPIPPSQEVWDHAFTASNELKATADCWSLFAYSDAPPPICTSGLGSFHWFQNKDGLIEFIRNCMAWWEPAPSSMQPAEIAGRVQAIVEAESGDLSAMISRLNESMRNMWQIDWCGQFRNLCEGDGEFPVKIREAYWEDDKRASRAPIPPDKISDFVEFLRAYEY